MHVLRMLWCASIHRVIAPGYKSRMHTASFQVRMGTWNACLTVSWSPRTRCWWICTSECIRNGHTTVALDTERRPTATAVSKSSTRDLRLCSFAVASLSLHRVMFGVVRIAQTNRLHRPTPSLCASVSRSFAPVLLSSTAQFTAAIGDRPISFFFVAFGFSECLLYCRQLMTVASLDVLAGVDWWSTKSNGVICWICVVCPAWSVRC